MKHAVSWFEIPTTQLDKGQAFYESVLGAKMMRTPMGPSEGAIFPYDRAAGAIGGALMMGPTAPAVSDGGPMIYLDAGDSLDSALDRAVKAGGEVMLPRQELPEGMGFFAQIKDLDGNRVGLYASA